MNHFQQIRSKLSDFGLDAMLLTCQANRFYASGFHSAGTDGLALVTQKSAYYFTDARYIEAATAHVQDAEVALMDRNHSYFALLNQVIAREGLSVLGFEAAYLTVEDWEKYRDKLECTLKPATALLLALRQIKDAEEIQTITAAQRIAEKAFAEILNELRIGVAEQEIAARLQYLMLHYGAQDKSFDPIVASGPNGSRPHGVPGARTLQAGDFVTLDFGCVCGGYCSDMTRTVAIGHATEEMSQVYETVLAAQQAGIAQAAAGVSGETLDRVAREIIAAAGYGDYFGHSLGHGVGVEIHEGPSLSYLNETPLPVGAVVTVEPGIYLPGRLGVRIEDMLALTQDGHQNLTLATKELLIL